MAVLGGALNGADLWCPPPAGRRPPVGRNACCGPAAAAWTALHSHGCRAPARGAGPWRAQRAGAPRPPTWLKPGRAPRRRLPCAARGPGPQRGDLGRGRAGRRAARGRGVHAPPCRRGRRRRRDAPQPLARCAARPACAPAGPAAPPQRTNAGPSRRQAAARTAHTAARRAPGRSCCRGRRPARAPPARAGSRAGSGRGACSRCSATSCSSATWTTGCWPATASPAPSRPRAAPRARAG
jgi:hypothetical protein